VHHLLPSPGDHPDLDEAYANPAGRWVRANMVASADGAANVAGRSEGLSSPTDRDVFTTLRGLADLVLVGAGTAGTENYGRPRIPAERIAARRAAGLADLPRIALVSRNLSIDPGSRLFQECRPLILTCARAPAEPLARLRELADVVIAGAEQVDLAGALDLLAADGLKHVLCEGGPTLLAALLAADRLDELCLTTSPQLVGGTAGRILAGRQPGPEPPATLSLAHVLEADSILFLRYLVRRPTA